MDSQIHDLHTASVLGTRIHLAGYDALIERMIGVDSPAPFPRISVYSHFHILTLAAGTPWLQELLNHATVNALDGIGTWLAARLLRAHAPRINATDDHVRCLRRALEENRRLFFLGGSEETVSRLLKISREKYPEAILDGQHGLLSTSDTTLLERIEAFKPDILFLGLGTPLQFEWIRDHALTLHVPVIVATGAFFNFAAGTRPRAPRWMRLIGLEWLHRMLLEPGRLWRRYILGIPTFLLRVLRERFRRPRQ